MRVIVQRVSKASVSIDGEVTGAIGPGLLCLVGVGEGDTDEEARWLAHKTANLRIFADQDDRMNLSVKDIDGAVLVVSQFTLYANTRKGFRPSFVGAAPPDVAEPLVDLYTEAIKDENVPVETGVFGAYMEVSLENDGPVTIILEKEA
jgi:D-tyrosyl-tRNA(Tyr) deacylase